jgi:GNAT superfamily N-acetyltransferase
MVRRILKGVARAVFGQYQVYWILAAQPERPRPTYSKQRIVVKEVSIDAIASAQSPTLRDQTWYVGDGAHVFVAEYGNQPVGACFYWHGERYLSRNFWPLLPGEAKLVQVIVDPAHRGKGVATALISSSATAMRLAGFARLYARVWHSNYPSLNAFRSADWRRIALAVEASLLGIKWRCNIPLKPRKTRTSPGSR